MNSSLIIILSALAIISAVVATVWSVVRPASALTSLKLDSLAKQAQPPEKIEVFGYSAAAAVVVGSLANYFIDDPQHGAAISTTLSFGVLVTCHWIRHLFQRMRALEELLQRSAPEIQSQIEGERA